MSNRRHAPRRSQVPMTLVRVWRLTTSDGAGLLPATVWGMLPNSIRSR